MKTETVISFFGTKTAVARALGISQVAVTRWGPVVPTACLTIPHHFSYAPVHFCAALTSSPNWVA